MTPRNKLFVNGVLRSSVSMPVFAIHMRETLPVTIEVDELIASMEVEDEKKQRPITNRAT